MSNAVGAENVISIRDEGKIGLLFLSFIPKGDRGIMFENEAADSDSDMINLCLNNTSLNSLRRFYTTSG